MARPDVEIIEREVRDAIMKMTQGRAPSTAMLGRAADALSYAREVEQERDDLRHPSTATVTRFFDARVKAEAERDAALRDLETAKGHIEALLAHTDCPCRSVGCDASAAAAFLTERSEEPR